jgi:hypothetical protein
MDSDINLLNEHAEHITEIRFNAIVYLSNVSSHINKNYDKGSRAHLEAGARCMVLATTDIDQALSVAQDILTRKHFGKLVRYANLAKEDILLEYVEFFK